MNDLERAIYLLAQGEFTLAMCKGELAYTDDRRGVVPLLWWLDHKELYDFTAADKVVGKAAAFLYLQMGIAAVYAEVISQPAYDLLTAHGVDVTYVELVPAIRNRAGDGYCPMETVTLPLTDPVEAEAAIRARLAELTRAQKG